MMSDPKNWYSNEEERLIGEFLLIGLTVLVIIATAFGYGVYKFLEWRG